MNYQEHFKIKLSEIELGNFESGYWKTEDFYVVDQALAKKETPKQITRSLPSRFSLAEIDCVFISYDEPNADRNWADLLAKAPWAKRVHGVKGSDAAHKAAAKLSDTERFITVDADNIVNPKFFNIALDFDAKPGLRDKQLSWCGKNYINNLVYGNGGLKCWTKEYVESMRTHEASLGEQAQVDFCWSNRYKQMANLHSVSYVNASPLQAWRAGFREGVKMTLNYGSKQELIDAKIQLEGRNFKRLLVWTSVGSDVENGLWAIYGARLGAYMTNCTDWDWTQVKDFDYLNELFNEKSSVDLIKEINNLGDELSLRFNLPMTFLNPEQSKFFKAAWSNPPRFDSMIAELDVNWDSMEL
jgi:hypothetical protein